MKSPEPGGKLQGEECVGELYEEIYERQLFDVYICEQTVCQAGRDCGGKGCRMGYITNRFWIGQGELPEAMGELFYQASYAGSREESFYSRECTTKGSKKNGLPVTFQIINSPIVLPVEKPNGKDFDSHQEVGRLDAEPAGESRSLLNTGGMVHVRERTVYRREGG